MIPYFIPNVDTILKKILKFIGLGVIILAIIALFIKQGWLIDAQKNLQNKFYDYNSASSEIVIVAIDEKSLQPENQGNFAQWKREYYAKAIRALEEAGSAAIGIDVTFPDPSIHGPEDDQILRDTLKEYDNVVLAARYYFENDVQKAEWPNSTLMESNPKTGWINVQLDEDGFVRSVPVFQRLDGKTTEAFSLQTTRIYNHADYGDYEISDGFFHFSEGINIPVITHYDKTRGHEVDLMYINYFAEPNRFTRISFSDVLNGTFIDKNGQPVDLTDKIVLIGPTAIDLQDNYLSPVSRGIRMSGVEVHANNIQTIIEKRFLRDQSRQSLWILLLVLLGVNVGIFSFLRVRYTLIIVILELLGILVAGIVTYEFRIFLNVIYPIMAVTLSFIGVYILRFMLSEQQKKFMHRAFTQYVNKDVVDQIMKNPKMLDLLGGEKREITVFFSDIKDFTSLSEGMEPGELVTFLNEYLTSMTDIILKHQGTLDKYIGDAIMALWNTPLDDPNHALNTCLAALENKKQLEKLCAKWRNEKRHTIEMRIGINTGEAVVGNMGSEKHFDYTAMGDNVNLASRLEGVNKSYGTSIIVSEATYEQTKDKLVFRELDLIRVKGRREPVRIFELVDEKGAATGDQDEFFKNFNEGLDLYRKKEFAKAKEKFDLPLNDPPSVVFSLRCDEFIKNPPAADWDGVWNFVTK